MSSSSPGGRHELGQNLLVDRSIIRSIQRLVAETTGPILELAAGNGALTLALSQSDRPVTAVELDPKHARRLDRKTPEHVTVVNDDILRFSFPRTPHVVVGNLPFHLTTSTLRRLLATQYWQSAILIVQWEVARRRAGVGGATMLTASWWPWYEFRLHSRVPARSFRPVPSVDGGLMSMTRRPVPLVSDRRRYQHLVKQAFTGPGNGLQDILVRACGLSRGSARTWIAAQRLGPRTLPKDLTAQQWASLWNLVNTQEAQRP
jgi:23S rRNA (adenine-N6)-dimethyltransferase